jgi:hypothetical protein
MLREITFIDLFDAVRSRGRTKRLRRSQEVHIGQHVALSKKFMALLTAVRELEQAQS